MRKCISSLHTLLCFLGLEIKFHSFKPNDRYDGRALLKKTVPDTITSWVISGFSLDQVYGLGVSDVPMKLRVFRPFFLSLNIPYSVVKGEALGVQVLVHNYMNRDVVADVTLDNSANQFTFTEDENEVDNSKSI